MGGDGWFNMRNSNHWKDFLGGDFNGLFGKDSRGYDSVHRGQWFGEGNELGLRRHYHGTCFGIWPSNSKHLL